MTMSVPKTIKAITLAAGKASVQSIPTPPLRPSYLLIKVHSVALNPSDWKHIAWSRGAEPFSIVGCDFAGEVVQIGDEVTKSFSVGDKVFGCAHGSNSSEGYDGIFVEYAAVKGDTTMKLPNNISFEDASTIGLGAITVGQGLFQKNKGLGLESPGEGNANGEWILIYGGSTATGTLGIQFAKLAGYNVITTASPHNHELVKSRGADAVFDYKDPSSASKIREFTGNKLRYAWDANGDDASAKYCAEALSSEAGGHYGTIGLNKPVRDDIKTTGTIMYTWFNLTEKLVAEGKVVAHPAKVGNGGLEGVLQGLDDMKNGKVSGQKLVYNL
ncbi:zinc-binding oxidoreductase protein [Rutstroemia sp. NJR-2017a BBW]|nr:zinc-binding oxidoreductase protein [Rutstroemia sp. NJR-2017a BBW]